MSTGKHWVTEPNQEINIVIDEKGFGARPPITVMQLLNSTVKKHGNENALGLKKPVNVSESDTFLLFSCLIFIC
jgi:hypothetical protein